MRRRTGSLCVLVLVAAATLPAPSSGAPARSCAPFDDFLYELTDYEHSQIGRFGVRATRVSCRSARRIVLDYRLHARVRPRWKCAAADAEAACARGPKRAAYVLARAVGANCGSDAELQVRAGIGTVWAAHRRCPNVLKVLRAWAAASPRPVDPEGFACRRVRSVMPASLTHYYCRGKAGALVRFPVSD